MRLQFKQPYHCRFGHDHKPGDTCELPDHVAVKLLGYGIAEAVRVAPVERAVKTPPEHTSKPKPKASRSSRPAKEEAEK